jgi:hypothetical protein
MRVPIRLGLALAATAAFGLSAMAQKSAAKLAPPGPGAVGPPVRAAQADVIVLGRIVEVEKDPVEAAPYKGAPKDQRASYKVAVLKIEEALVGGKGLTQFRVGFPADAAAAPPPIVGSTDAVPLPGRLPPGRPGAPVVVALTADMEGCFFLSPHPDGDFYVAVGGPPLLKKDKDYAKELDEVKKVVKAIEDPLAALKAKDQADRFRAAQLILQRYQTPRGNTTTREPIPEEENKLIVALMSELPWMPDPPKPTAPGETLPPCRSNLWYLINPAELGFKQPRPGPQKAGDPPVDFNKLMDAETAKFLKENADKIKIRRYARK